MSRLQTTSNQGAALISAGVAVVQQSLIDTVNAPGFVIPAATPEEQLEKVDDRLPPPPGALL